MARRIRSIATAAGVLLLVVCLGAPAWGGDPEGRPAAARSLEPDQLSGTPPSPASGAPETVTPGSLAAPSSSPDSLVAHARSPGSESGTGDTVSSAAGASTAVSPDLSRLPVDTGGEDLPARTPELVPEPTPPAADAPAALLKAWQAVRGAEKKLDAAQGAYTRMMLRNYPVGAARVRIERHRVAAIGAVNRARRRYARLAAREQ